MLFNFGEAHPAKDEVAIGKAHANPYDFPKLFTDPVNVTFTINPEAARMLGLSEDYEFECTCYPHTPLAEFEVTMPDGYHFQSWATFADEDMREHSALWLALAVHLDHALHEQNRFGEIFPASDQLTQLDLEQSELERTNPSLQSEEKRDFPDPKDPITVTFSEPRR